MKLLFLAFFSSFFTFGEVSTPEHVNTLPAPETLLCVHDGNGKVHCTVYADGADCFIGIDGDSIYASGPDC